MVGERIKICVLAIVLLCGSVSIEAFAYGYDKNVQSESWGYQPVGGSSASVESLNPVSGISSAPTYRFHTTSPIINSLNDDHGSMMMDLNRARRTSSWDDFEEGNPLGEVDDTTPVGDTPWLFIIILLAGYIAFRSLHLIVPYLSRMSLVNRRYGVANGKKRNGHCHIPASLENADAD